MTRSYYDLHALVDGFTLFPDPIEVFAEEVELHSQYLLPLATVDLSLIDDNLAGKVHFISPIEPFDELVGDGAEAFFTYLTRSNYIGYRYIGDKCVFDGDFQFFKHRRLSMTDAMTAEQRNEKNYLDECYADVRLGD